MPGTGKGPPAEALARELLDAMARTKAEFRTMTLQSLEAIRRSRLLLNATRRLVQPSAPEGREDGE